LGGHDLLLTATGETLEKYNIDCSKSHSFIKILSQEQLPTMKDKVAELTFSD